MSSRKRSLNVGAPVGPSASKRPAETHLSHATFPFHTIQEIHQAAVDAHLTASRDELLGGLPASIVASLPMAASRAGQILGDLHALNEIGQLDDGSSPLAAWLANAAALARDRPQEMPWASPLATLLRAGVSAALGDKTQTARLLREAAVGLEAADMALYAAAARYREGKLIGGGEGRALWTRADQWMSDQGVVNRERLVGMLAPGFE